MSDTEHNAPTSVGGDNIAVGDVGSKAVVAVGQGATAAVNIAGDQSNLSGDFRGANINIQSTVTTAAPVPIPLQRPPRAEHFTDRQAELNQLLSDLQPGRTVTLYGPGGIGKTALAAEAIWNLAPGNSPPDHFPDGVVFHTFYGRRQIAHTLETIANAYNFDLLPNPSLAVQRALSARRALLLLDGAEEADDLPALLALTGGCGVLVTTRQRTAGLSQTIDTLPLAEATQLLQTWGGHRAANTDAARRICTLVGCLPLAVRLAGSYMKETEENAADYLAWLQTSPLAALDPYHSQHQSHSVPLLLEHSLSQLSLTACQVLAVVGLLDSAAFTSQIVATTLNLDDEQTRRALSQLVRYSLLNRPNDRYQVSHILVHIYAHRQLTPPPQALPRLADHYTMLAQAESQRGAAGYAVLDEERPHIVAIVYACQQSEHWQATYHLVDAIQDYLRLQGHNTDRLATLPIGLRAAQALADRLGEANCIKALGDTHLSLAEYKAAQACYDEALPIYQSISNRLGEATCIQTMGDVYRDMSEHKAARARYEQALPIYQLIGDHLGKANCIQAIGDTYRMLAEYEAARACYEQALPTFQSIGDRLGEAKCIKKLGDVHRRLAEYDAAQTCYDRALPIYQAMGARLGEANCIRAMGDVRRMLNEYEAALACYDGALPIYQAIGAHLGEAINHFRISQVLYAQGQRADAVALAQTALDTLTQLNVPNVAAIVQEQLDAWRAESGD